MAKRVLFVLNPNAGRGEIRALIAEGKPVTLNCHFCNTDYTFTQEELIGILQKLQAPKQPRTEAMENLTSSMAGMPPSLSYIGCQARIYGSAYTASSSGWVSGRSGTF